MKGFIKLIRSNSSDRSAHLSYVASCHGRSIQSYIYSQEARRCDIYFPAEKRISRVRWWVYNPASCIGRTQAGVLVSLWWECHHPGGVENTAPVLHTHLTGFFTHPSSSNSGPISVYTLSPGSADTHKSNATELCRWGRCASPAGRVLRRDHRVWVNVLVESSVILLPSRMPMRLRCSAPGWCLMRSTSARSLSLRNKVALNFFTVGFTPR